MGGAIGNLLTGDIAKLVMAWWTKEFNTLAATTAPEPILVDETDTLYIDNYISNTTSFLQAPDEMKKRRRWIL